LWSARNDDQSWLHAGLLHIAEGHWKQALFALGRIVDAVSNGTVLEALGRALAGDGQIDAAIQTFDQAIQLQPDNPQTLVAYSQARSNMVVMIMPMSRLVEPTKAILAMSMPCSK
jgi:Flp pilus assembly protein TadD